MKIQEYKFSKGFLIFVSCLVLIGLAFPTINLITALNIRYRSGIERQAKVATKQIEDSDFDFFAKAGFKEYTLQVHLIDDPDWKGYPKFIEVTGVDWERISPNDIIPVMVSYPGKYSVRIVPKHLNLPEWKWFKIIFLIIVGTTLLVFNRVRMIPIHRKK